MVKEKNPMMLLDSGSEMEIIPLHIPEPLALQEPLMNKADLVDKISGSARISKTQAATAIDTLVETITGALKKGDRVTLSGFGTFCVSQRKARNGRNPQTGALIKIAARKVARFSAGVELKKAVNKSK